MKVVTAAEMLSIEKIAQEKFHISPLIMMENAGKEAASFINSNFFDKFNNKRVAIFAGKGNNAGDGFVVARHLHNMGAHIRVVMLNNPEELSQNALLNFQIIKSMGIRCQTLATDRDLHTLKIALLYTDIIVDAVYGTGFKGIPPVFVNKVFEMINSSGIPVVALDVPSGVEADTGKVGRTAVRATWTLAMGLPKIGLVTNSGSEFTGKIELLDISLPKSLLINEQLCRSIITSQLCAEFLPKRKVNSHKGTYGHLLIVGGSGDMSGAATLTARASGRSGCGLITLAVPQSLQYMVASQIPHIMTKSLPQTDKVSISKDAVNEIEKLFGGVQALVIGPGMSRHPDTMEFVRQIVEKARTPLVIDADALFAFKGKTEIFKKCSVPIILTPHPGEMAMLTEKNIEDIQRARVEVAESFAKEFGVTLVLKGYRTIVASKAGLSYIATSGNSGLAKGGTGDVLAGVIGALLAQGINAVNAAAIAVHLHGRSGDICAEKFSVHGMNALDVIENLTLAWKEIEN